MRRLTFDLLFLAVIGWGASILTAIGIEAIRDWGVVQPILLGLVLALLGAVIGAFAVSRREVRTGSPYAARAGLFMAAFAISLSCGVLFVKLFIVLGELRSGEQASYIAPVLSMTLLPASTLIAAMIAVLRPEPAGSLAAEPEIAEPAAAATRQISIEDVVITDPNVVCPLCRTRPGHFKHVIIRCPDCGTLFCSKHLKDLNFRCHRCRAPIPFRKEIELFLKLK